ncbi:acyltransferase [Ramlibacter sp.]|uniref:acyltransferase family protein n=1 Tax=Ramlibacter sp. TaxID=1917967 RepID=UPI00181F5AC7|nr:acyltransferase [Ramlibacter sp.]MBA2673756.1 acyltransferase [Ramlibacter sp.]
MHTPAAASSSQPNNFDFVRLVAALCVVVSHQFALTGRPEPTVLNVHSLGGLGVLIFFSVSGYLVAQSWNADPHVPRFAARRLLRIWPGLAVLVLLTAFVWGPSLTFIPLKEYFRHVWVRDYLNNLRFVMRDILPVRFDGNALPFAVNGPLWTIPLELKCYVMLAVLGAAGLLRSKWWMIALTAVLLVRYAVVEPRGDLLIHNLAWTLEQRYLLEFGLFFAAGVILQSLRVGGRWSMVLVGGGWALGAAALLMQRPLLALWFMIPVTVIAFGVASTPFVRRTGRFGDFSYGLYIYTFPVQQTLIWLYGKQLPWGAVFALVLATALVCAAASWHLVESRALKLKPKRAKDKQPRGRDGVPAVGAKALS